MQESENCGRSAVVHADVITISLPQLSEARAFRGRFEILMTLCRFALWTRRSTVVFILEAFI